jgi:hypothetical protein
VLAHDRSRRHAFRLAACPTRVVRLSANSYKFTEQHGSLGRCLTAIPSILKGSRQWKVKFAATMLSINHSLEWVCSKHDFHLCCCAATSTRAPAHRWKPKTMMILRHIVSALWYFCSLTEAYSIRPMVFLLALRRPASSADPRRRCLEWQRIGVAPPAVEATDEYLASEDSIGNWIADRCVVDTTAWENVTALLTLS